jgi:hypothetical protein
MSEFGLSACAKGKEKQRSKNGKNDFIWGTIVM